MECGTFTTGRHHVVPVSSGGKQTVPLCTDCHGLVHGTLVLSPSLVKAGLKKAREQGVELGRPSKAKDPKHIEKVSSLRASGLSIRKIRAETGLATETIQKILSKISGG